MFSKYFHVDGKLIDDPIFDFMRKPYSKNFEWALFRKDTIGLPKCGRTK